MAGLALLKPLQDFLGGKPSAPAAAPADDFADFAGAASPAPPNHAASSAFSDAATTGKPTPGSIFNAGTGRPYTKWYRVWERVTIADFYQELVIIPIIIVIIIVNLIGASLNRKRAKQWAQTNLPLLESEFARVGWNNYTKDAISKDPEKMYKQKSKNEYITYCTGRQNVAFLDVKLTLYKRYNPLIMFGESALSFFMDGFAPPVERLEATAYCFDGKEKSLVPAKTQAMGSAASKDSTFDGFVFAVVHKDKMKQLRDDRYDLSLTSTKDHPKLPSWATVMSESAEVTEAMLTPELLKAVEEAGEDLEALVVSDQPIDAPKKLNDIVSKKRVYLSMRMNNSTSSSALFTYFLRLPDHLVNSAHFRAEAMRKIKATREEEMRKLRKLDEDEKAEERKTQAEKLKKEERDRKLSKMSADEQRKFLEKEKEKSQRKNMKKQTMRGDSRWSCVAKRLLRYDVLHHPVSGRLAHVQTQKPIRSAALVCCRLNPLLRWWGMDTLSSLKKRADDYAVQGKLEAAEVMFECLQSHCTFCFRPSTSHSTGVGLQMAYLCLNVLVSLVWLGLRRNAIDRVASWAAEIRATLAPHPPAVAMALVESDGSQHIDHVMIMMRLSRSFVDPRAHLAPMLAAMKLFPIQTDYLSHDISLLELAASQVSNETAAELLQVKNTSVGKFPFPVFNSCWDPTLDNTNVVGWQDVKHLGELSAEEKKEIHALEKRAGLPISNI